MEVLKRQRERLGRMTMVGLFLVVFALAPAWAKSIVVDGIKSHIPMTLTPTMTQMMIL